jgi:membrane-bound lytic murein transglycosylase A
MQPFLLFRYSRFNALCLALLLSLFAAACSNKSVKPASTEPISSASPQTYPEAPSVSSLPIPDIKITEPITTQPPAPFTSAGEYPQLKLSSWQAIDGFKEDNLTQAWPAWLLSCSTLINKAAWTEVCRVAQSLKAKPSPAEIQAYFMQYFSVYQSTNQDGSNTGLVTGYYAPILKGSRQKSNLYPYALYTTPSDLITVELQNLFPELKFKRVRGRLIDNKLVPYFNRAEIETQNSPIKNNAFIYIDDIIDVFFLHIQGSGLVQLENGTSVHVGYADQNGHPYNSIGRLLIERGELTPATASMQGIKNWARQNPSKLNELLNSNPSYVFFRELPPNLPGPLGALGVPILAERVIAVDPKYTPLGAPVFLSTTEPNSAKTLKRLMMAQDTGGAIKGGVRADFFWGAGNEAGNKAGAMKQTGKMWVLLPKDFVVPNIPN